MSDQPTLQHLHHHRTRKLKRTLLFTIGGGILFTVLLLATILIVTSRIDSEKSNSEKTAITTVDTILKDQEEFVLPENTSNAPDPLDEDTLITVIAKNQPAVVRILSWRCADVTITAPSTTLNMSDICTGGVGSGSIISSDGYIATNGHVTTVGDESLVVAGLDSAQKVSKYLSILIDLDIVTETDANTLLSRFNADSTSIDSVIEESVGFIPNANLSIKKDDMSYAVQLGNEPVRLIQKGSRDAPDFTNSNIEAVFVDKNYDPKTSNEALKGESSFTSSDVALLKASGEFPYVELGDIDSIEVGDQLTAIGFPAFLDNAVRTDQWQTVPSITQGDVVDISHSVAYGGYTVISTSVKIAQGNSGGPAFDDEGKQIGLNTYSHIECEDLQCFGDGEVRDIADLKELLNKNNITLVQGGITDDWNQGLLAYTSGNYSEALTAFQKVQDDYPANYLVAPLSRLAREQVGSTTDTSSAFQTRSTVMVILIIVGFVVLIIIATVVFLIIYFTRKHQKAMSALPPPLPPTIPV